MGKMERQHTHPGKILREDYLKPLPITITEMASIIGVSRKTLSKISNGRASVTPDMTLRLSRAFDIIPNL
jgi:addiction module HigA family antidote